MSGLVVTSSKFVVVRATKSGLPCFFGVFVADATAAAQPYAGVLAISSTPSVDGPSGPICPGGLDAIPDAIKVGDLVNVIGKLSETGPSPSQCVAAGSGSPTPGKERTLALCSLEVAGSATPPIPLDVAIGDIQDGSAGLDGRMSIPVRVTNVEAATAAGPSDSKYTLTGTTMPVSNLLYFKGIPTGATIALGDQFSSISGVPHLDFCTWMLLPRTCGEQVLQGGGSPCP